MDIVDVVLLLDPPVQQALVFLERNGKSLEIAFITLYTAELLSGEEEDGEDVVEVWPSWSGGAEFSIGCSVGCP